jgi:quercetin dioxygenase-like cupin family protein
MTTFQELAEVAPTKIWDGVLARIVQSELLTMAIVELEPNSVVPAHQHHNEQLGFVIRGSITFTVDGQTRVFGPGGTWRILSNVPHQAAAGPEGAVVAEVYSPVRQDWAAIETGDPVPPRWPA